MHHETALKQIDKSIKNKVFDLALNAVHKHMIAIGIKQVPVCRKHHLELHRYNWTNKPIKTSNETK